jgi:hypothetical protein
MEASSVSSSEAFIGDFPFSVQFCRFDRQKKRAKSGFANAN